MGTDSTRYLGLDPGLRATGWGVIDVRGNHFTHVAHGTVKVPARGDLARRLSDLHGALTEVVAEYAPHQAAVEETFVNVNGRSTLALGQARGVVMLAPAMAGIQVFEYPANLVKKSVAGFGHADKEQVAAMIRHILPGAEIEAGDSADALAIAVCHANHAGLRAAQSTAMAGAGD